MMNAIVDVTMNAIMNVIWNVNVIVNDQSGIDNRIDNRKWFEFIIITNLLLIRYQSDTNCWIS